MADTEFDDYTELGAMLGVAAFFLIIGYMVFAMLNPRSGVYPSQVILDRSSAEVVHVGEGSVVLHTREGILQQVQISANEWANMGVVKVEGIETPVLYCDTLETKDFRVNNQFVLFKAEGCKLETNSLKGFLE